jgi:two-component system response regulator
MDQLKDSRPAEILLVEDNENDVVLTRLSFKRARLAVNLHHVENGEECMAFLRKTGPYANAVTPDIILLDLNMPVMDGREVLTEIVADEGLCHLPVVVLTTSAEHRDIRDMYKLRCSSYITKPVDFDQFQRVLLEFANYWFALVVLPDEESSSGSK